MCNCVRLPSSRKRGLALTRGPPQSPLSHELPELRAAWDVESFGAVRARCRDHLCEDDVYFDDCAGLFAVMHGVGGGGFSGRMSTEACRGVLAEASTSRWYRDDLTASGALIQSMQDAINDAVRQAAPHNYEGVSNGVLGLALLRHQGAYLVCSHVGDARVYRLRDARLESMTVDHTLLAEASSRGVTPSPNWKDVITRGLHTNQALVRATHRCWRMQPGDRVFACTSGVHRRLTESELLEFLQRPASPSRVTAELHDRLANIEGPWHSAFVVLDIVGPNTPARPASGVSSHDEHVPSLRDARALTNAGRYREAVVLIAPEAERLRRSGPRPAAIRATLLESRALLGDERRDEALQRARWAVETIDKEPYLGDAFASLVVESHFTFAHTASVHDGVPLEQAAAAIDQGFAYLKQQQLLAWRAGLVFLRSKLLAKANDPAALPTLRAAVVAKRLNPVSPGPSLESLLRNLGSALQDAGEFDEARHILEELRAKESSSASERLAVALQLVHDATAARDSARAVASLEEATDEARSLGPSFRLAALGAAVDVWLLVGDRPRAQACADEGLEIAQTLGRPTLLALARQDAFDVAIELGDRTAARVHLDAMRRAVAHLHEGGDHHLDDAVTQRLARLRDSE